MTRVYFSIGSNVEPFRHIALAVRELENRFGKIDVSPVYRNKALGFAGDDFLNLVAGVDSGMNVKRICGAIDAIHLLAKRKPNCSKMVSRTLDIDLLLYGQLVTDGPPLVLPRIDVLKYSFALKPLTDIAPDERHPQTGKTYTEHWAAMDQLAHPLQRVEFDPTSWASDRINAI